MIKVAAITQGGYVPSARYRVRQLIPYLKEQGILVTEYFPRYTLPPSLQALPKGLRRFFSLSILPAKFFSRLMHLRKSNAFDIVWLQREMIEGYLTLESHIRPPVVFDVDDAIWLTNRDIREKPSSFLKGVSCIAAGNKFLANWFSKVNKNVIVVPTSVDTRRFIPAPKRKKRASFIIGWIGTSSNLSNLELIERPLMNFFNRHPDSKLLLVSNAKPHFPKMGYKQVEFVKWSEGLEVSAIQEMDVGIMPLKDTEWTKGKCSFKMLQYMACGVPVISSPVGMNREVFEKGQIGLPVHSIDEWLGALEFFYKNRESAKKMGEEGRRVVISHYSSEVVSKILARVFQSLGKTSK